ncbi:MAG: hypothetical protein K7J15_04650 [Candidatus Regiella insecticola]|nr:hypothetical protein [Candidatus Regiella insecticola]
MIFLTIKLNYFTRKYIIVNWMYKEDYFVFIIVIIIIIIIMTYCECRVLKLYFTSQYLTITSG